MWRQLTDSYVFITRHQPYGPFRGCGFNVAMIMQITKILKPWAQSSVCKWHGELNTTRRPRLSTEQRSVAPVTPVVMVRGRGRLRSSPVIVVGDWVWCVQKPAVYTNCLQPLNWNSRLRRKDLRVSCATVHLHAWMKRQWALSVRMRAPNYAWCHPSCTSMRYWSRVWSAV